VASQADVWKPHQILVEDTSAGQSAIQALKAATRFPVKAVKVDKDRRLRAEAATGWFEAGKVFFPETAPWLHDFMDEMASFPSAPHDDQVDSVTQALNYMRGKPTHGFTEFCDAVIAAGGVDQYFAQREKEHDQEVTAVNPKTGQRIRLVDNRWVDCTTGVPI